MEGLAEHQNDGSRAANGFHEEFTNNLSPKIRSAEGVNSQ